MALPPITVQLGLFEQLEILRQEIEAREEELKEVEHKLRGIVWDYERLRFLRTLHPLFGQEKEPAGLSDVPALQGRREALGQALEVMKARLTQLERETRGQTAPPAHTSYSRAPLPTAPLPAASVRRPMGGLDDFGSPRRPPSGFRP